MDEKQTNQRCAMKDGVFYLDGEALFLSTADYPYYRDDAGNWPDRLQKLKDIGHRIISLYIPWRHHEVDWGGERIIDFDGKTLENRNVIRLLDLCRELSLLVIAKPGPFIHGELNYGGLPDRVCPQWNDSIEAMLDSRGEACVWEGSTLANDGRQMEMWPLPAPFDRSYQSEVRHWLQSVTDHILSPYSYPDGPVVLVQVANEGIYSNHQRPLWAYDFSRSSLDKYRCYLQRRYADITRYNCLHDTSYQTWDEIDAVRSWQKPRHKTDLLAYEDWADYQIEYVGDYYAFLKAEIPESLPCLINVNPPTADSFGIDAWLARIVPERWPDIHYGFTNWIGVACDDDSVIDRYQLMVKRRNGMNLEENWGFSSLYEPAFEYDSVSFYQTLLAIASGATGYNIYTGVGTACTTPQLDMIRQEIYPDLSPIDRDGKITPKGESVQLLNRFFSAYGEDLVQSQPYRCMAWGLYLPDSQVRTWAAEKDWQLLDAMGIGEGGRAFMRFQACMRESCLDYGLVNLQAASLSQLRGYPTLGLAAGRIMDAATQQKLRQYVDQGGQLLLFGEIPALDENLQPCAVLEQANNRWTSFSKDELYHSMAWMECIQTGEAPVFQRISQAAKDSHLWCHHFPQSHVQYLFILSGKRCNDELDYRYRVGEKTHHLRLALPERSGAVFRIENGSLSAVLVKGINEYNGVSVVPACELDGQTFSADRVCDWLKIGGQEFFVHTGGHDNLT